MVLGKTQPITESLFNKLLCRCRQGVTRTANKVMILFHYHNQYIYTVYCWNNGPTSPLLSNKTKPNNSVNCGLNPGKFVDGPHVPRMTWGTERLCVCFVCVCYSSSGAVNRSKFIRVPNKEKPHLRSSQEKN